MSRAIAVIVLFLWGSTQVSAAPLLGYWNLTDGLKTNTDMTGDGNASGIGDTTWNRATDLSWDGSGGTITGKNLGAFTSNGDGTGTRTFETFVSGSTLTLDGEAIWGQAAGTSYTVNMIGGGVGTGIAYFNWIDSNWVWDRSEGTASASGVFDGDPMAVAIGFNFVMDTYLPASGSDPAMMTGTITNASMTISAIPIPAAIWLFGSGLVGLFAFGRRQQHASYS